MITVTIFIVLMGILAIIELHEFGRERRGTDETDSHRAVGPDPDLPGGWRCECGSTRHTAGAGRVQSRQQRGDVRPGPVGEREGLRRAREQRGGERRPLSDHDSTAEHHYHNPGAPDHDHHGDGNHTHGDNVPHHRHDRVNYSAITNRAYFRDTIAERAAYDNGFAYGIAYAAGLLRAGAAEARWNKVHAVTGVHRAGERRPDRSDGIVAADGRFLFPLDDEEA